MMRRIKRKTLKIKITAGASFIALFIAPAFADISGDVPTKNYVTTQAGSLALSGDVYLYGYAPAMPGGAPSFDLYASILNMDITSLDGLYGFHSQMRYRDDRLRSFYVSNFWFQEAYAYRKTTYGEIDVGKFYRRVGIFWDDSFFGNIQYFNGFKLNPEYGVEFRGDRSLNKTFDVRYTAQFFPNNSNTDGSLPGRSVDSDPFAQMRNIADARVVSTWRFGENKSLALGLSALNSSLATSTGPTSDYNVNQVAGDLTFTYGPSISYVEVLNQNGVLDTPQAYWSRPGYDSGIYLLAGSRYQVNSWMNVRMNYSSANYVGQNSLEQEFVPGIVFTLDKNLYLIEEFDYWRITPRGGGPQALLDRSYNTVLHFIF